MTPEVISWWNPANNFWQWSNICVGLIGLIATFCAYFESWKAARSAMDAETAAKQARNAVLDVVRLERLSQLSRELEELHHLTELPDLLSKTCNRIKAAIMGYKTEVEAILDATSLANLDLVREQLSSVLEAAYNPRGLTPSNRSQRLMIAFGEMVTAVSIVKASMEIQLSKDVQ